MELLKKIEDIVAPLVGLSTADADTPEKALPEVTDPEGIVEDEYCMDGRKKVGTPAEIAKERAGIDLSKCAGYKLAEVKETGSGLKATLSLDGQAADLYGKDIKDLTVEVEYETPTRLHVHIYDTARQQFRIPETTLARCSSESASANASELKFEYTSSPFAFWISRRSSGDVIFDTRPSPLVFSDQFLHIVTKLPSETNVYGPSEIVSESGFRRDPAGSHSTLWTRDAGTPVHENIYGAHPFYMETRYPSSSAGGKSQSHGVFLRNSHGMDISQTPTAMTYNIIGGTLDFYFIAGPSQQDIVRQYAQIVGMPARQPFWAFGLHMCRWNRDDPKGEWGTPEGVWEIVEKMKEAGVPLETVWSDLDYMDKVRNWDSNEKWSPAKYKALIDKLHAHNQHYVPIIDAAIGISDPEDKDDKYFAYEKGTELDVWVKDKDGATYVGEVWPGKTVFPDWTHPRTDEWWKACFDKYRTYAPYDGIWLDMNEPASFQTERPIPKGELDPYDFPKYKIDNAYGELWEKTLSPSSKLADGTRHYHQHNLFGHCENISTRKMLLEQEPEKRPFIISRSTFAGTGQLSGHWLGDNYSTWTSMRNSIQGILMFQMFQIPMVGPDACGFSGDCTEELANRWMQLGAFYPFFRNHNVEQAKPQEPFRWPSVAEASRKAIDVRYRLLPYWETLFAQASQSGTPPVRPLAWEFDEPKYAPVHQQFLLGHAILVTPVLKRGGVQVTGYLPKANGPWRDWWTHKSVETDADDKATLPTPLGSINVHIRAGSVLLVHNKSAYTLTETKAGSYGLIVSLDDDGKAEGDAVIDDGRTNDSKTTHVSFSASSAGIKINGSGEYAAPKLTSITVLGSTSSTSKVTVGGQEVEVQSGAHSFTFGLAVDLRESTEIKF